MDYFGKLAFFVALVYITRAFGNDLGDINQKRKNEAAHEGICLENAPSNNIDEVTLMDDLKTNFQVKIRLIFLKYKQSNFDSIPNIFNQYTF